MGGYFLEYNNFIPADPLKTPLHIAPVWYFTPFYSMLRAITDRDDVRADRAVVAAGAVLARAQGQAVGGMFKVRGRWSAAVVVVALLLTIDAKFWGVVVMGGAVVILFFLPWLDHSPVKSIRYRPSWHKYVYARVRRQLPDPGLPRHRSRRRRSATLVSQVGTLFYFGFFLLMPWWSRLGDVQAGARPRDLRSPLSDARQDIT